jgi:hypothetical protein
MTFNTPCIATICLPGNHPESDAVFGHFNGPLSTGAPWQGDFHAMGPNPRQESPRPPHYHELQRVLDDTRPRNE